MKSEIVKGFLVGLVATVFGIVFAIQIFGTSDDYGVVVKQAISEGFLGKLMSIGALLNLGAFFIFLKKKQDLRARGVLIATVFVLIITLLLKYFNS
jgi:formate-dependent nitrite reductase membrane component NrfD